jgi:hypothetical protein
LVVGVDGELEVGREVVVGLGGMERCREGRAVVETVGAVGAQEPCS